MLLVPCDSPSMSSNHLQSAFSGLRLSSWHSRIPPSPGLYLRQVLCHHRLGGELLQCLFNDELALTTELAGEEVTTKDLLELVNIVVDDDSATVGVTISQDGGGGGTSNDGRAQDDVDKANQGGDETGEDLDILCPI